MRLFHAFPRPPHQTKLGGRGGQHLPADEERWKGFEILRLILTHGLLCTPEKFKLYPNYNTENKDKQQCLQTNKPHEKIVQSRACFTLVDALELTKEYEMSQRQPIQYATHIDLFGEFAIGLDPIEARALGIMPTVYYYRHDINAPSTRTAGLGTQIVERLDEIRTLFSILSYVETKANEGDMRFLSPEILRSIGIQVRYEIDVEAELTKLEAENASLIFRLFNTDRVPGWNLVDFVEIMLSLYQTTDSTFEDAPLAFFQQKEWRLIHHMMAGLKWFGLGNHPSYRNPRAGHFANAIKEIKSFIRKTSPGKGEDYLSWFFYHSWVLAGTEDRHFRDFVREIVVPENFCKQANAIIDSLPFTSAPPIVIPLPPRWRIKTENGIPYIIKPQIDE